MKKTLAETIEDYLVHQSSLNFSQATITGNRNRLRRFRRWLADHDEVHTLDQLRSEHLQRWRNSLCTWRTIKGLPLKATSLNRHLISVRGLLDELIRQGFLHQAMLDELPYQKEPHLLPGNVLTHAQIRKLLTRIPTHTTLGYRDRAMLEVMYSSGLRVSELLGLNLDNVHLDHCVALVRGKGSKERMVPIGKTAVRHLETYLKAVRPYLQRDPEEAALFIHDKNGGRRLSYSTFARMLKAHAAAAGLGVAITPHTFRRSCTTELIRGGANMYHVKELLGHESLDTLNRYVKLTIHDLKKTHAKTHPREKDR